MKYFKRQQIRKSECTRMASTTFITIHVAVLSVFNQSCLAFDGALFPKGPVPNYDEFISKMQRRHNYSHIVIRR